MTSQEIFDQAVHLRHSGEQGKAKELFRQIVQQDPEFARAYYYLGLIATEEGSRAEAIVFYETAIAKNPRYHQAHNNLGLLYWEQKQFDAAIGCFRKARELAPQDPHAVVNLARAYHQQKDFGRVFSTLEGFDLSMLDPTVRETMQIILADSYINLQGIPKAQALLNEILQANPKNPIAMNLNAFIELEVTHDLAKAMVWVDQSLAIQPNYKPALQNKGLILKGLRKSKEAITWLEKVVQLEPQSFEGYYNLACVYAEMGDNDQVKKYLTQALKLAPQIKNHVKADKDLEAYRKLPWFRQLVEDQR